MGITNSQSLIHGGDGADSIRIVSYMSSSTGSINGGAGNDTITIGSSGIATTANAAALVTLNGGDGTDTFKLGSGLVTTTTNVVTNTSLSAVNMVVLAWRHHRSRYVHRNHPVQLGRWRCVQHLSGGCIHRTDDGCWKHGCSWRHRCFLDNTDSFIAVQTNAMNTSTTIFIIKITET